MTHHEVKEQPVYALVIAVLIAGDMGPPPAQNYSLFTGFMHLASGLSVGLAGLAAGYAIGIVGDMGVRSYMQQSRIFVGMVLITLLGGELRRVPRTRATGGAEQLRGVE